MASYLSALRLVGGANNDFDLLFKQGSGTISTLAGTGDDLTIRGLRNVLCLLFTPYKNVTPKLYFVSSVKTHTLPHGVTFAPDPGDPGGGPDMRHSSTLTRCTRFYISL